MSTGKENCYAGFMKGLVIHNILILKNGAVQNSVNRTSKVTIAKFKPSKLGGITYLNYYSDNGLETNIHYKFLICSLN